MCDQGSVYVLFTFYLLLGMDIGRDFAFGHAARFPRQEIEGFHYG